MHWTCCNISEFSAQHLQQVYACLSPSRKAHIDNLHRPEDKDRSLAAEALVYQLLRQHYGITDALLHRASNGQPYLTGCELQVSISHSGEKVACAISRQSVGIDIERIRPIKLNLLRQVCVEEEKAYILACQVLPEDVFCEDSEILTRFFEIWTGKEAYFKRQGTGITDMRSVNVLTLSRQFYAVDGYMVQII